MPAMLTLQPRQWITLRENTSGYSSRVRFGTIPTHAKRSYPKRQASYASLSRTGNYPLLRSDHRMNRRAVTLLIGCSLLAACKATTEQRRIERIPAASQNVAAFAPDVAPSHKEILRVLLKNQDVHLAIDPSCSGVGTSPTDHGPGDYVSGFLAEQGTRQGSNWIEVSAKPDQSADHAGVWRCHVVIRHGDGDDRWGWGFRF